MENLPVGPISSPVIFPRSLQRLDDVFAKLMSRETISVQDKYCSVDEYSQKNSCVAPDRWRIAIQSLRQFISLREIKIAKARRTSPFLKIFKNSCKVVQ